MNSDGWLIIAEEQARSATAKRKDDHDQQQRGGGEMVRWVSQSMGIISVEVGNMGLIGEKK